MKKNILVISSHIPSLKIPQAGHKSAFMILKNLSKEYNIFLITFQNYFEKSYYDNEELNFCKQIDIVEQTKFTKVLNILKNISLPLRVATRKDKNIDILIKKYLNLYEFERIHFEFTSSMVYLKQFNINDFYLECSEHDITYQSYIRKIHESNALKRIFYKFEFNRFKKWELDALNTMNKIIVHNSKDAELLYKEKIKKDKIEIIKPYIDPIFSKAKQDKRESNSLIFWGAMNRIENEDAILWFIDKILPLIRIEIPDIIVYVVGNKPSSKLENLNSEYIIITGFVENPIKYFEKATIAIAPLRLGAGIKVKVLESLASGLQVISTNIGAEGIIDNNLIIAESEKEFSTAVIDTLITMGKKNVL